MTVHVAREAIMEYWGTHNYCASLPPPYACSTTTAHLRVGNTPATHEFAAHADKCSASTEIRHDSLSLRQEAVSVFRFEFNSALLTHCLVTVVPRAFPVSRLKYPERTLCAATEFLFSCPAPIRKGSGHETMTFQGQRL